MYGYSKATSVSGIKRAKFTQVSYFYTAMKLGLLLGGVLGFGAYFFLNQYFFADLHLVQQLAVLFGSAITGGLLIMLMAGLVAAWIKNSRVSKLESMVGSAGVVLIVDCQQTLYAQLKSITETQMEKYAR